MKTRKFIKHLREHNCYLERHGSNHDMYKNNSNGRVAFVPRHPTIGKHLCEGICKQLGIPKP